MSPSTFDGVLASRRSVRHYTDAPLSREEVAEVIAAAAWAPSGGNDQPWAVTALAPDAAADFRARWERRGWQGLLPKLASLVERRAGGALPFADARVAAERMVEDEGIVRGRPWALLVREVRAGIPRRHVDSLLAMTSDAAAKDAVDLLNGAIDAEVTRASVHAFVTTLCLAARARGFGTCIQHAYLAFAAEIAAAYGLPTGEPLVSVVILGRPDEASPVVARAAAAASRRPVAVEWKG